jgi:hypothetical protein
MNESDLKTLWRKATESSDERVNPADIIGSMKPMKWFTLAVGCVWVGVGGFLLSMIYLYGFSVANKFFLYSATIQVSITAIALVIYIYQLIKIYQVDVTNSIIQTQKTLAQLQLTTLLEARIMFLQLPVWTTFWWTETMVAEWSLMQWAIPVTVTALFTVVSIWLFIHIRYENRNKKWFQLIFSGKDWTPLMKAMAMTEELEEYRSE